MAYPKYSTIKYDSKSPEELLETFSGEDWLTTAFKGLRTFNALVQEQRDMEFQKLQRQNITDGYIVEAMNSAMAQFKENPNDLGAANQAVDDTTEILANHKVRDANSPIVYAARGRLNYLNRERDELVQVNSMINEMESDNGGLYALEMFIDIPNAEGWDQASGESSMTEKAIDDAIGWVNKHQKELERMGRYEGIAKQLIDDKRKMLDNARSFAVGHDGFIEMKDLKNIRAGQTLQQAYKDASTEYNNKVGQTTDLRNELYHLEKKVADWSAENDPFYGTFGIGKAITDSEHERMQELPELIKSSAQEEVVMKNDLKRHKYDWTGRGDPYAAEKLDEDVFGISTMMTTEKYKEGGFRKLPSESDIDPATKEPYKVYEYTVYDKKSGEVSGTIQGYEVGRTKTYDGEGEHIGFDVQIKKKDGEVVVVQDEVGYRGQRTLDKGNVLGEAKKPKEDVSGFKVLGGPAGHGVEDILDSSTVEKISTYIERKYGKKGAFGKVGGIDMSTGIVYDDNGNKITGLGGEPVKLNKTLLAQVQKQAAAREPLENLKKKVKLDYATINTDATKGPIGVHIAENGELGLMMDKDGKIIDRYFLDNAGTFKVLDKDGLPTTKDNALAKKVKRVARLYHEQMERYNANPTQKAGERLKRYDKQFSKIMGVVSN